jgi:hypothetical protein
LVNFFLTAPAERIRVCFVEENVFVAEFASSAVAQYVAAVGSRQVWPFKLVFHLSLEVARAAARCVRVQTPPASPRRLGANLVA